MGKLLDKKLIFIINHFSGNSDQHLFHVINLVNVLAEKGVKIALIIERCEGVPPIMNENVIVYAQKQKQKAKRLLELIGTIFRFMKNGYKKVFIRITVPSAKAASWCAKFLGGETYYWNSGGLNERPEDPHTSKESQHTIKRIKSVGRCVDHFVTGPESMLEFYPKYCGVPKKKMLLLYNDIDVNRFAPVSGSQRNMLRQELGLAERKTYVLFVHRFSPIRRSLYYVPFCLKDISNPDIEFLLIGSGPEEQAVRDVVASSGQKNIRFLGSLPNTTIQKYYQACDVFFNPSYCEGFPRVIIEAMACGMPIVTTNAGGTADLFGEYQSQYVLDVDDRDGLAEKLCVMLDSPEIRNRCIEENLKQIKKYSTDAVSDMYIKAFWPEF